LVVNQTEKGKPTRSVLLDLKTLRTANLPTVLSAPYAWNSEGTELLGWRDGKGYVVHARSGEVVRTLTLKSAPNHAVWLSKGHRDLLLATDRDVSLVRGGRVRTIAKASEQIAAIGYDAPRDRAIYAEALDVPKGRRDEIPNVHLRVGAVPLEGGPAETLIADLSAKEVLGEGRYALPVQLSVSPDGQRIAIAGLVEASAPGVFQRYVALNDRVSKKPGDARLREELRRVERSLKFDSVVATVDFNGLGHSVVARRADVRGFPEYPGEIVWSSDGMRLGVSYEDGLRVADVTR